MKTKAFWIWMFCFLFSAQIYAHWFKREKKPGLVSNEFDCARGLEKKIPIVLVGEEHETPQATKLRKILETKAKKGELTLAVEGSALGNSNLPKNTVGIEDEQYHAWTSFLLILVDFEAKKQNVQVPHQTERNRAIRFSSILSRLNSDPYLKRVWKELARPLTPQSAENSALALEKAWRNDSLNKVKLEDPEKLISELMKISAKHLEERGAVIMGKAPTKWTEKYLQNRKLKNDEYLDIIVHARDKIFAQNIARSYCDALKKNKNMTKFVAIVGAMHVRGVESILKEQSQNLFPVKAVGTAVEIKGQKINKIRLKP